MANESNDFGIGAICLGISFGILYRSWPQGVIRLPYTVRHRWSFIPGMYVITILMVYECDWFLVAPDIQHAYLLATIGMRSVALTDYVLYGE